MAYRDNRPFSRSDLNIFKLSSDYTDLLRERAVLERRSALAGGSVRPFDLGLPRVSMDDPLFSGPHAVAVFRELAERPAGVRRQDIEQANAMMSRRLPESLYLKAENERRLAWWDEEDRRRRALVDDAALSTIRERQRDVEERIAAVRTRMASTQADSARAIACKVRVLLDGAADPTGAILADIERLACRPRAREAAPIPFVRAFGWLRGLTAPPATGRP